MHLTFTPNKYTCYHSSIQTVDQAKTDTTMVTCEIKLIYFKTILKLFPRFISQVTTDSGIWNKTLKLFQNYYGILFRM